MKKLFFTLLFFGFTILMTAQGTPEVGDTLIIKETSNGNFNYVKFPKLNFLIKRGVVGNYKSVYNTNVIVDDVITKDDGTIYVMLKKKDGTKFFGYLNEVKANYNKAFAASEIVEVK